MTEQNQSTQPNLLESYSNKIKNDKQWFKQSADYYFQCSRFKDGSSSTGEELSDLYNAYNGFFPTKWFKHITDPYRTSGDNSEGSMPAKIRPVSVIRTNLDQLISEFNRRPLRFMVVNSSPEGYDTYNEEQTKVLQQNLEQHFIAALKGMGAIPTAENEEEQEVPLPDEVLKQFKSTWRDALAIMGQAWLEDAIDKYNIKESFLKMFKHWIIAGETYSFKGVYNGKLYYQSVSPRDIDYHRNESTTFVEDAPWVCARYLMSLQDVVAMFYGEVSKKQLNQLQEPSSYTPNTFYTALSNSHVSGTQMGGVIPIYHIQWTAYKEVRIIEYLDPETMMPVTEEVDEDYEINPELEKIVERHWLPEKYEAWKLADGMYAFLQPVAVQRTDGGIISTCKNGYNGRTYSDLHSKNVSVLKMGMPFQLMCMIINWKIEFFIGKSKGKIALLDKNIIPKKEGWTDAKFFHYAEAKGWGLIDRNQVGVDKSFNQYQVLDMSMYDNIKQLIDLYQYYKQQWDEILGMSPQRKGQMTGTDDLVGTTQNSVFQSTVITDMIFVNFEQLINRDLEGLLDMSRYVIAAEEEYKKIRYFDDMSYELVRITPDQYCAHALGVKLSSSSKDFEVLNTMKGQLGNLVQNGTKASTLLSMLQADNIAKLKQDLLRIEEIQAQAEQAQSEQEAQLAEQQNELNKDFETFKNELDLLKIDAEWDRKDQNEMIKGEFNTYTFSDGDSNDNGVPDGQEAAAALQKRMSDLEKERTKRMDLKQKDIMQQRELAQRERESKRKAATDRVKARSKPKK
jgi:hypothetical protein